LDLDFKNVKFEGLNNGEFIDFSKVNNKDKLKEKIIAEYVATCRKCPSENDCKHYDHREPSCVIISRFVRNYIDMNIKSIDVSKEYHLTNFVNSIILMTNILNLFEQWRGIYANTDYNFFYESEHPRLNQFYSSELLILIGKYIQSNRVVDTKRVKKFRLFVEGDSEETAFPEILSSFYINTNGISDYRDIKIHNIKGKDTAQLDKIKLNLERFRENDVTYFIFLDNDENVHRYRDDWIREGLIESNHFIIWDNKFEDNFGEEVIFEILEEISFEYVNLFTVDKLKETNKQRKDIMDSIKKILYENGKTVNMDEYKVRIAQKIGKQVSEVLSRVDPLLAFEHQFPNPFDNNEFLEFMKIIQSVVKDIERITSEHFVDTEKQD